MVSLSRKTVGLEASDTTTGSERRTQVVGVSTDTTSSMTREKKPNWHFFVFPFIIQNNQDAGNRSDWRLL